MNLFRYVKKSNIQGLVRVFACVLFMFFCNLLVANAASDVLVENASFVGGTGGSKIVNTDIRENILDTEGIIYDPDASLVYEITITNQSSNYKKIYDIVAPNRDYELEYQILSIDKENVIKPGETVTFQYAIRAKELETEDMNNFNEEAQAVLLFQDVKIQNPNTWSFIGIIFIVLLLSGIVFWKTRNKKLSLQVLLFFLLLGSIVKNTPVSYAEEKEEVKLNTSVKYITSNLAPSCANTNYKGNFCIDWKKYSTIDKTNYIIMTDTKQMENEYSIDNLSFDLVNTYDVSEQQNEDVILGVYKAKTDEESYLLLLGQEEGVVAPKDAAYQFTSYITEDNDSTNDFKYIKYVDFSKFYSNKTTNMSYMLTGIGSSVPLEKYDFSGFETSNVTNMSGMFAGVGEETENLKLDLSMFDTSNVTDMSWMFWEVGAYAESIDLDLSCFDTGKVTNMSHMFYNFGLRANQISLNIYDFDTSQVKDMSYMFSRFATLSTSNLVIDYFKNWDTSQVENMQSMFGASLSDTRNNGYTEIDLRGLDFDHVQSVYAMFAFNCYIKSIQFDSTVDLSNITDFKYMFTMTGFFSPTPIEIDFTRFIVSNATDISYMFQAANIKEADLSTWDVSHVEKADGLFDLFVGNSIQLSGWKLESLQSSATMFASLQNIERLDLSDVDFQNSQKYDNMFKGTTTYPSVIDISGSSWNPEASSKNMFSGITGSTIYVKDEKAKAFIEKQAPDCTVTIK